MAVTLSHEPHRPSWDCLCCGRPWPCDAAREQLTAIYGRIALAAHAWDRLEQAVGELPPTPAAELFDRFIRWTR